MAKEKPNRLARTDTFISLGQWVWDRSSALLTAGAGAGLMGYLASITDWLNAWGPIAWGGIVLSVFVAPYALVTWGVGAMAKARLQRAQAKIAEIAADTSSINPLDDRFLKKRIRLIDLQTPDAEPIVGRSFDDCDLIGPATILTADCRFSDTRFHNVEFVKLKAPAIAKTHSKMIFERCRIDGCRIFNVVFLVPEPQVPAIEEALKGVTWLA